MGIFIIIDATGYHYCMHDDSTFERYVAKIGSYLEVFHTSNWEKTSKKFKMETRILILFLDYYIYR